MSTTQNETVRSINDTIQRALQEAGYGSYFSYARPVVEALTRRETDLSEKLIDYAVDAGADADEVKAYLREIGMAVTPDPTPEPEVDESDDEDSVLARIDERLATLAATVESLSRFARDNGYRG